MDGWDKLVERYQEDYKKDRKCIKIFVSPEVSFEFHENGTVEVWSVSYNSTLKITVCDYLRPQYMNDIIYALKRKM